MKNGIFENVRFLNDTCSLSESSKHTILEFVVFLNEISIKKIVYDKAKYHIENGIPKDQTVNIFKAIFEWLDEKCLLNDDGKEIIKEKIFDEELSLHSGLLNARGIAFMSTFYDKIIKNTKFNEKKIIYAFDRAFKSIKAKFILSSIPKNNNTMTYNDVLNQINAFDHQQQMNMTNQMNIFNHQQQMDMAMQAHTMAVNNHAIATFGYPIM